MTEGGKEKGNRRENKVKNGIMQQEKGRQGRERIIRKHNKGKKE